MKKAKTGFLTLLAAVALVFAGATMVQAVALEDCDGTGDVLIFPLYLATSAAYTEFTLVNTAGEVTSVHIQIKSQGDSRDQLDFCIDMTKYDVYRAKIASDGAGGAILTTVNNVDSKPTDWTGAWHTAPATADLIETDMSSCSYNTQRGYIIAYAVSDCSSPYDLVNTGALMGNTRIIETATSKIMSLNAVAVEVDATPTFEEVQEALAKDELYMLWENEKTAAVLTVPSFGTQDPANDDLCGKLVGSVGGDLKSNLCGCGFVQLDTDFEYMYNLDEKLLSRKSPHYYPANEVSIVNFADAGSNTDSTNFYVNGSPVNWGLNFTSDTLDEGWTKWVIPVSASPDTSALHNVVCTYFMVTENSLAWLPCQYED